MSPCCQYQLESISSINQTLHHTSSQLYITDTTTGQQRLGICHHDPGYLHYGYQVLEHLKISQDHPPSVLIQRRSCPLSSSCNCIK